MQIILLRRCMFSSKANEILFLFAMFATLSWCSLGNNKRLTTDRLLTPSGFHLSLIPSTSVRLTPSVQRHLAMPIRIFLWNGLYSGHPAERALVKRRIQEHYNRRGLKKRRVAIVSIR
jgi:hypothetical protein